MKKLLCFTSILHLATKPTLLFLQSRLLKDESILIFVKPLYQIIAYLAKLATIICTSVVRRGNDKHLVFVLWRYLKDTCDIVHPLKQKHLTQCHCIQLIYWVEVLHLELHVSGYVRCPCKGHGVGYFWLLLLLLENKTGGNKQYGNDKCKCVISDRNLPTFRLR